MNGTIEEELLADLFTAGNGLFCALMNEGCNPRIQEDFRMVLARFGQPYADMWATWRAIQNLSEYHRMK
jgi:hypothetical protein